MGDMQITTCCTNKNKRITLQTLQSCVLRVTVQDDMYFKRPRSERILHGNQVFHTGGTKSWKNLL